MFAAIRPGLTEPKGHFRSVFAILTQKYGLARQSHTPRCTFVELYLNRQYQGVYLLTETIKVGEHRVNIPKDEFSYLLEFSSTERTGETVSRAKAHNEKSEITENMR